MEFCVSCKTIVVERDNNHKIVKAIPHIVCAKCGSTICYPCGKQQTECPICGYKGY